MSYIHRLCKIAKDLDRPIELQHDPEIHKFLVTINNVVHKEKHLRRNISGTGFTIEDAAYDYIRKALCGELENYTTNKVIKII